MTGPKLWIRVAVRILPYLISVKVSIQSLMDDFSINLNAYGICGINLKWISSFLSNHRPRVVVNVAQSSSLSVVSSVPQGTVLKPLLFLLYINDITPVSYTHLTLPTNREV